MLPFIMIPFEEAFFVENINIPQPENEIDMLMVAMSSIISGTLSTILFYFIGKKLGGNDDWKKIFSVMFHTHVPTIPMMMSLSIPLFLMMDSLASLDRDVLIMTEFEEGIELAIFGPLILY